MATKRAKAKKKSPARKKVKRPAPKPWEMQLDETLEAFQAFVTYRDQGENRSVARVAQVLSKSQTVIKRWSAGHGWVERMRAWEGEIDRRSVDKHMREVVNMRVRQARIGEAMQTISATRLKTIAEGNGVELTVAEVRKFAKDGASLERVARGEPDSIVGSTVDAKVDLGGLDLAELEKLRELSTKIRKGT